MMLWKILFPKLILLTYYNISSKELYQVMSVNEFF